MQITKWKVEKTYKGAEEEYITFRSSYTSCSKAFVVGKRYIIYAYERESTRKEARFATGRCTHTAEIGDVPVEEIELQSDSGGEL